MIEPRSLPQLGQSNKSHLAGSGSRAGGNQCGDVHVGVLDSSTEDEPSDEVPHLRADGKDGSGLAVGFRSLLTGFMSNWNRNSRVLQSAANSNAVVNLRVVPAVSKLSDGAGVAPWSNGFRHLDGTRNMDAVSHTAVTLMPFSLLIKMIPLAGAIGGFLSFVEGGRAVDILLSGVVGAGGFAGIVGAIKYFIDRADKRRADILALSRTDSQFSLEREKLLDSQTVALMKQAEEFYAIRDKEKQGIIDLQKVMIDQRDKTIEQLQTLVTALSAQSQRGNPS